MDLVSDILKDANKNPQSILKHKGNKYLRNLMEVAYIPEKKMLLPEGDPPYKKNEELSPVVTGGAFWQICRKMDIFLKENLKPIMREGQFITALENVSEEDAQILLKAKDQKMQELFPELSYEKLKDIGYF